MSTYSTLSDHELVHLLQNGDKDAFAEIYARFFGLLYVHAYRKLGDEDEASDLIQELFASLWEKQPSLRVSENLSSYLYTSVRNRVLNLIERRKVNQRYMCSLADYSETDHKYADEKLRESELRQMIEKEINSLPEQMRIIFQMSRHEYLSYKEIGERLEMSEQAVKSVMKRTLKVLRQRLGLFVFLMIFFHLV
ncbi:RNA polymerase sigma-70 factor [Mucilaginibacter sp. cycad4]|uniref:RNA polymerase sigma factor n=1 Tax=Mucilaginibacter sp. cycad4 TaxID=3342096 RepID=UPI002AAC0800|nr:RNA polymerase sigma-70 factor [Mucilaginibacter gossypii]WPU99047.1 RNA polymerase sigma-70 factor [Mucilaginibacter gossypii]